jgi:protein-disulfide isomerase
VAAREVFERVSRAVVSLAAIAIAISVVRVSFFTPARQPSRASAEEHILFPLWDKALSIGIRDQNLEVPVTVVMFADFECPVCASYHKMLMDIHSEQRHRFSLVHVHYPLTYHRFAYAAARAAECAAQAGRFESFSSTLYSKQDSIGLLSWGQLALAAGIPDSGRIANCARATNTIPRIEAGIALGKEARIPGTPTIVINGRQFTSPPQRERLRDILAAAAEGQDPFAKR